MNQSVINSVKANLTLRGNPPDLGIGNVGGQTQRVVLASDQPALSTTFPSGSAVDATLVGPYGPQLQVASIAVTLASDQPTVPVSDKIFDECIIPVSGVLPSSVIMVGGDKAGFAGRLSLNSDGYTNTNIEKVGDFLLALNNGFADAGTIRVTSAQDDIPLGLIKGRVQEISEATAVVGDPAPVRGLVLGGMNGDTELEHVKVEGASLFVDFQKLNGSDPNVNGGNKDAGTLTVTLADDDSQAAAILANQVLELAKLDDVKSNQVELFEKFDNVGLFGDFRVSEITPTYQSHFVNMVPDKEWHKNTVGAATVAHKDESGFYFMELKGSTAGDPAADDCLAYTRKTFHYRNGQIGIMRCVVACPDGVGANNDMHAGHFWGLGHPFDDETSVLSEQFMGFHYSADGFIIAHRVKNYGFRAYVASGSWNGTPLTMTLDPTKLNLYEIRFYWLGVGGIEFRIFDSVENKFITVHTISYTNSGLECITSTPLLAPTFGIKMPTTVVDRTVALRMLVSSVGCFIGGKRNISFPVRSIFHGETGVTNGTTVLNIRNMDAVNGIKNWANVRIKQISISATNSGANLTTLAIYKNGTVTGATWVDLDTNESVIETDIVSAGGGSDGTLLYAIPLANDDSKVVDLSNCDLTFYQNEVINIVVNMTAGNSDVQISILIQEDI